MNDVKMTDATQTAKFVYLLIAHYAGKQVISISGDRKVVDIDWNGVERAAANIHDELSDDYILALLSTLALSVRDGTWTVPKHEQN